MYIFGIASERPTLKRRDLALHSQGFPRKESRFPIRSKKSLLRHHRKALEQGNKLWGIFLVLGFLLNFLLPILSLSSGPGGALFFEHASGLDIALLIFSLLIGIFQGYLAALLLFGKPRERIYLYCSVSFFVVAAAKMLSMCFMFDLMQLLGLPVQVAFGITFLRKATSIRAIEEFEQRDSG